MLSNDVITLLSSDEEVEASPPKKRTKLVPVPSPKLKKIQADIPSTSKPKERSSCIILSDDDEDVESKRNDTVNELAPTDAKTKHTEEESDSKSSRKSVENGNSDYDDHADITKLFKDFLKICMENIKVPEQRTIVKDKLVYMQDAFDKYLERANDTSSFRDGLELNLENIVKKPTHTVIYFTDVYQLLKVKLRDVTHVATGKEKIIRKLERVLGKLKKRIDKLDEAEVNFDDEENSCFLQVARYKQRAAEIHAKLCKYRKVNPYTGRISHQRLKFNKSKYPEINDAINKKYKNNTVFPVYREMLRLITNCVKESGIAMSDIDIQIETRKCFETLGNFIQAQRKLELYSVHSDYLIDTSDDPAKDDPALQGKLLDSYQVKVEKEADIFEKFSTMQEKGVKCEDSEEASVADSDSDNNENDGNEANENVDFIMID